MLRKIVVSVVIGGASIALAVVIAGWLVKTRPQPQRQAPVTRAPLVETLVLSSTDVREKLYAFGTVRCDQQATLTAEVSAAVIERVGDLEEGDVVSTGQTLIRLDDRQYQQDLAEAVAMGESAAAELAQIQVERANLSNLLEIAESDLTLNRDELARVEGLYREGNAPKTEYDDARLAYQNALRAKQDLDNQIALLEPRRLRFVAQHTAAEARTGRARLNMERCQITAPFDGSVSRIMVETGDRVQMGNELLTLVNLERVEIPLELPISDRLRTELDAAVSIGVESMPGVAWEGRLARIAPVANERSRTFAAYIDVDNRAQRKPLMPGVFVRAVVDGPMVQAALILPRSAVLNGHVFVANDHRAHERRVNVEHLLGEEVAVAGDVQPGDNVIVTNLDLLYDGAVVRIAGEVASDMNGTPVSANAAVTEAGP